MLSSLSNLYPLLIGKYTPGWEPLYYAKSIITRMYVFLRFKS